MSSDNGFLIRKNKARKFVLQEYCASAEGFPSVESPRGQKFDTLEEAIRAYNKLVHTDGYICEYGLTIDLDNPEPTNLPYKD